jgi:hypothetical protein
MLGASAGERAAEGGALARHAVNRLLLATRRFQSTEREPS